MIAWKRASSACRPGRACNADEGTNAEGELIIAADENPSAETAVSNVRANWAEAFQNLGPDDETQFISDATFPNDFDEDEWTWP
jgi:hypothetical protein